MANKKMFVKKARLVYKIDVNKFYDELMNDALQFDALLSERNKRMWLIEYELRKLHAVILKYRITASRFHKEMFKNDDAFCNKYMVFLPKNRRKVLWKKLKSEIMKKKLR